MISGRYLAQYRATSSPEREQNRLKRLVLPEANTLLRTELLSKPWDTKQNEPRVGQSATALGAPAQLQLGAPGSSSTAGRAADPANSTSSGHGHGHAPADRERARVGAQASCSSPSCPESSVLHVSTGINKQRKGERLVSTSSLSERHRHKK